MIGPCDTRSHQRVRSGRPTFRLVSKPVPILSSVTGNSGVVELEEKPKKRFSHQTKSGQGKGGKGAA